MTRQLSSGLPAIDDAAGKPLLSWRVMLLPYLEQAPLYHQFRFNEPWDSEHNKKLLQHMPAVYAAPGIKTKEPGMTYYQGFVGKGAGWEYEPGFKIRMPASFLD